MGKNGIFFFVLLCMCFLNLGLGFGADDYIRMRIRLLITDLVSTSSNNSNLEDGDDKDSLTMTDYIERNNLFMKTKTSSMLIPYEDIPVLCGIPTKYRAVHEVFRCMNPAKLEANMKRIVEIRRSFWFTFHGICLTVKLNLLDNDDPNCY